MVSVKFEKASVMTFGDDEHLVLTLPTYSEKVNARKFVAEKSDKLHVAELKQHRNKRSIDFNNRFWTVCGRLASVLNIPKTDVYRGYIRDIGDNFEIVPIREDAVETWIKNWEHRGLGWLCDIVGESKHEGYINVMCFYGSSVYNTKQMWDLFQLLKYDCIENNVEWLSPAELDELEKQSNSN